MSGTALKYGRWDRELGHAMARAMESIAPGFGYHVALTGGLLYGDGDRKDGDFVLYEIITGKGDREGLLGALFTELGIRIERTTGYVDKMRWGPFGFDLLWPELDTRDYPVEEQGIDDVKTPL